MLFPPKYTIFFITIILKNFFKANFFLTFFQKSKKVRNIFPNFYSLESQNNQINKLKSDFIKQQNVWTPTMIIWDFNLSPWSYYYKQLVKNRNMKNSLSFQSPNYTRSLLQQWIFRSHIDQLFISPEIKISNIKIENLSWSDHRSFTFSFWTKN